MAERKVGQVLWWALAQTLGWKAVVILGSVIGLADTLHWP